MLLDHYTATITIFASAALIIWLFAGVPLGEVKFLFTEKNIQQLAGSEENITFAIISDVHYRNTARQEITDRDGTIHILNQFMKSMNEDVKPDFIVQLGDFNDGCQKNCSKRALEATIIERLAAVEKLTESKTSIPWFDVIGNHEYAEPGSDPMQTKILRAVNKNWGKTSDTWYFRDIKGYRFIFLNTAYPYTASRSHLIPQEEISWLRKVLQDNDKPVFVFMHVPISDGDGSEYDRAIHQEEVAQLLAEDANFVAGFFGHTHHSDKWDGIRKQFDNEGNMYFHIPAPHEWMGNKSLHPWAIVSINPQEDGFTVEVGTGVRRSEISEMYFYLLQRAKKKYSKSTHSRK